MYAQTGIFRSAQKRVVEQTGIQGVRGDYLYESSCYGEEK